MYIFTVSIEIYAKTVKYRLSGQGTWRPQTVSITAEQNSKKGVCNIYLFINQRTFRVRAIVLTGDFQTPVQNISFNSTLPYNMEWNF